MKRVINEIIIHCSATKPDWMKRSSLKSQVKEIRRWHMQERGWRDIGYHWIFGRNGDTLEGRPAYQQGAHTIGHNRNTLGFCLIGGHGGSATDDFEYHFTLEQHRALFTFLKTFREAEPTIKITGHNQYAAKGCPSFDVQTFLIQTGLEPSNNPNPLPRSVYASKSKSNPNRLLT